MQTLREVAVGKTVSVVKLHGEGAVKRRIMDMGITKGTQILPRLKPCNNFRFYMQSSLYKSFL